MLDTNELQNAAQALQIYIEDVQDNIKVMNNAIFDCIDNMGSDQYSEKAADQLQECIKGITASVIEAQILHGKILRKIEEIEESQNIL
ncbi:hypothetical protein [uncultured Streptococcus sp.]|uniref:hypothetical protein n=1 Tax=uncultured Streptococcus sp. TaxID=83427 RepID=UPI00261CAC29|nr:hypothetical protein [uncultured Streptococcus sp.]